MISIFSPSPDRDSSMTGALCPLPWRERAMGEGENHANENTSVEQLYMDKENYYP
jgi:hypothetical protein